MEGDNNKSDGVDAWGSNRYVCCCCFHWNCNCLLLFFNRKTNIKLQMQWFHSIQMRIFCFLYVVSIYILPIEPWLNLYAFAFVHIAWCSVAHPYVHAVVNHSKMTWMPFDWRLLLFLAIITTTWTSSCARALCSNNSPNSISRVARMPVERYASEYNMKHGKRGMAIIFNHEHFEVMSLKPRAGTNVDCENLRNTLDRLNFDVTVLKDLRFSDIQHHIEQSKFAVLHTHTQHF